MHTILADTTIMKKIKEKSFSVTDIPHIMMLLSKIYDRYICVHIYTQLYLIVHNEIKIDPI